jgi:DNA-binding response OmpR family regulator
MNRTQDEFTSGAGSGAPGAVETAGLVGAPAGWLALADEEGPIDLARLFPGIDVRVEASSAAFSDALAVTLPSLVVLMAPPAGPADLQRVAGWLDNHPHATAVVLSPHQAVAVRLHALELGFYDAVDLSSDPMEVVGRLSIAGRRAPAGGQSPTGRIPVGDGVELDRGARAIRRGARMIPLRPKELALLEFLAAHPGRAYSREELLRLVWHESAGHERMVDVYVFWLRSKIERDPANPAHLLTVRGSGYLFDPPRLVGRELANLASHGSRI